jgi:tetratricopeptide (TPR) repeat protein
MTLINYYEILGVKQTSSFQDVKRCFRQRAKELHPDLQMSPTPDSDEEMKLLLKAYDILSNPRKRQEYDRLFFIYYHDPQIQFNYREFLKSRKNDLTSQTQLIFYDLLHSRAEEALGLYERLSSAPSFKLHRYLSWGDYMDCAFLLAEAFDARGEYFKAFSLFKQLYMAELSRPYFRHFIEEVTERIKILVCTRMIRILPPNMTLGFLRELLSFNFSHKDKAYFYKKMAELYYALGDNKKAIRSLKRGLQFNKKLSGVKKLKEKIGYPELQVS